MLLKMKENQIKFSIRNSQQERANNAGVVAKWEDELGKQTYDELLLTLRHERTGSELDWDTHGKYKVY